MRDHLIRSSPERLRHRLRKPHLAAVGDKDAFESDTEEIGSGCHFLPHFNPDTNANADLIGYEYKMDSSNPDSDPDTFSI